MWLAAESSLLTPLQQKIRDCAIIFVSSLASLSSGLNLFWFKNSPSMIISIQNALSSASSSTTPNFPRTQLLIGHDMQPDKFAPTELTRSVPIARLSLYP